MELLDEFYKSCKNYKKSLDFDIIKQYALQLLNLNYNYTYKQNTEAFIVYNCSYIYISKPNTDIFNIIALVVKLFVKFNRKSYSEIINQYLGALYVYCFDLLWLWYNCNQIDKKIIYAICDIVSNLNFSINNLGNIINISNYFDNIVIGNGTSSGIYVKDFDINESVLVIEQGQYITYEPAIIQGKPFALYDIFYLLPETVVNNISSFLNISNIISEGTRYMAYYNANASNGPLSNITDGRRLYAGTTVGGSSTHNYLQTVFYSKGFFDKIEMIGGSNWGYDAMYKRFRSVTSGELNFIDNKIHYTQEKESPFLTNLLQMIKNNPPNVDKGITLTFDYNEGYNNVLAITNKVYTYPNFLRCSVPAALLPLTKMRFMGFTKNNSGIWYHIERPNVTYLTNTVVNKINMEYNVATSVNTSNGTVFGNRIICSAGTIDSAQIIQNSGIGDPLVLEKANTPLVLSNINVGKFYTHYGPFIQFKLKEPISIENEPIGTTWSLAFLKMLPNYISRSVECIFQSVVTPNTKQITDFQILCFMLQPIEYGIDNITRNNGEPKIFYNFYNNDGDLYLTKEVISYFNKLFSDIAIMTHPKSDVLSDINKLKEYLGTYHYIDGITTAGTVISYHMCGSLALGKVVDKNLKVYGIKNLYVVDNSVWPIIPDGNTEAAALIVGKLFGDYLKKRS